MTQNGTTDALVSGRRKQEMKTKTNCKAGGENLNHSETLVRDNGKNLKVKTALRAGYKRATS